MTQMKAQEKARDFVWWWGRAKQDMERPQVEYIPCQGKTSFTYKNRRLWFNHQELEKVKVGWNNQLKAQEKIWVTCWGRDTTILKDLVDDAIDYNMEKDSSMTNIYEMHRFGWGWEKVIQKQPRKLETVVLDSDISTRLIEDIKTFRKSAEWYISKGVPYRRGYILHGPPGTGKTSFVSAVAAHLQLNICYLNLSGSQLDDDGLNRLLNQAPMESIILLEDIDAIFVERTSVQAKKKGRQVSFSGLLNALDGVRSQEGRILIMTTNHIEKLDPALLRPGRADMKCELTYASEN